MSLSANGIVPTKFVAHSSKSTLKTIVWASLAYIPRHLRVNISPKVLTRSIRRYFPAVSLLSIVAAFDPPSSLHPNYIGEF